MRVSARVPAVLATVLAVGACSNAQQDEASRQPTLRVADAALASGAPDMALRVAELTLAREPRNARAKIARGDALYAMGQRGPAEAAYRAAIAIDPTAVGAQVGLGRVLVRTDARAAEAAFVTALKSEPGNITALNNLGIARDMQGRYGDAEQAYYEALGRAPGSAEVQVNLGLSLTLSGHSDEAVRLLRGVAADPAAAQAWRKELTDALTLAGDGPWAQQTLQADPAQAEAEVAPAADRVRFASAPDQSPVVVADASQAEAPAVRHDPQELATMPGDSVGAGAHPPRPAPRVPVLKMDLGSVVATAPAILPMPAVAPRPAIAVLRPAAQIAVAKLPEASGNEPFVQLGSLNSEAEAVSEWRRLGRLMSEAMTGRQPTMLPAEVHGRTYWRLRVIGFASMAEANSLCGQLKAAAQRCWSGRETAEAKISAAAKPSGVSAQRGD